MVSLVDIVPQRRVVQINGGQELELRGLGLRQIAELLLRFPSLRNLITRGAPEISAEELLIMAPDAIAAIVAEAAGQPDAAAAIADGALSVDDLAACLIAIRELTMPNGAAPFFSRVAAILETANPDPSGEDRDTISPPPPND